MPSYSLEQLLTSCACSILATAVVLVSVYRLWPATRRLVLRRHPIRIIEWPHPSDVNESADGAGVATRYREIAYRKTLLLSKRRQRDLIKLFFALDLYKSMYWLGIPVLKSPSDMWMIQQLITEVRPDCIVETGTYYGGSALYYAQVLDGLGLPNAKVITIDLQDRTEYVSSKPLWKKRVNFVLGSSIDIEIVTRISQETDGKRVIVILDSAHTKQHVLAELQEYSPFVSVESYIVVEDTAFDSVPLRPARDDNGAAAAVRAFLQSDLGAEFAPDSSREIYLTTFHPGGWLKRRGR